MTEELRRSRQHVKTPQGDLAYFLIRSRRRRTLAIHVNRDAELRVFAPQNEEECRIEAFIRQHVGWILKKTEQIQNWAGQKRLIPKFQDGQTLLFLGKEHRLSVQPTLRKSATVEFNSIDGWSVGLPAEFLEKNPAQTIHDAMVRWYKQEALEILGGRVFHYSRLMSLEPLKITVKKQKTMWGSCHPTRKSINLNWKIIMAPINVVDYVVVHELSHIRVPNHSRKFWQEVQKVLPDYKDRHRWLRDNAVRLSVEET